MHIIFDLDGTLLNPFPRIYNIHVDLSHKYHLSPLSFQKYRQMKRNKIPEISLIQSRSLNIKKSYEKERKRLLENIRYISFDTLYPFTLDVLKILKKNHYLYLATVRKNKKILMDQLCNLKINNYFDRVLVPKSKEDIKISSQREETIIVGDTEADILVGKKFNLITIAITYGMRSKNMLLKLKPDYIIDNLKLLPYIVGGGKK